MNKIYIDREKLTKLEQKNMYKIVSLLNTKIGTEEITSNPLYFA